MNNEQYLSIKKQLSSFANDEDSVYIDNSGYCTLERRFGELLELQLKEKNGILYVIYNNKEYTYKDFVSSELAHLDDFAKRIISRHVQSQMYVDPKATFYNNVSKPTESLSLEILGEECSNSLINGTKICFVTADAGHGKTMLLKKYMIQQAECFITKRSSYIFWHIDLHGRQLVRLSEAIMAELGDLRIDGIYFESIITLIKNNLLVLAIDGFDELAAEIGNENALGSLNDFVTKLDGEGIIVAASRRAFFNTQDYLKRSKLIQKKVNANCEIHEIKLHNWRQDQCEKYISMIFDDSHRIYSKMLQILKSQSHPLLERPFLFTKICLCAFDASITPDVFIASHTNRPLTNIDSVIEEFVKREVIKWHDPETAKPYLTFEQHIVLLSEIALEMWKVQKESISTETIQFLLTLLLDDWKIEKNFWQKIVIMVESHAFLIPHESNPKHRRFDHEEFRYYFLARAFQNIMQKDFSSGNYEKTISFLKTSSLPLSVPQYISNRLSNDDKCHLAEGLLSLSNKDWKPTYLQPNIGNSIPFLLDKTKHINTFNITGITFQSIAFENKTMDKICFKQCTFVNISFKETKMNYVSFTDCSFYGITFYKTGNYMDCVSIDNNCNITSVSIVDVDGELTTEYAPYCINQILCEMNMRQAETIKTNDTPNSFTIKNTEFRKATHRFLNKYCNSAYQYEKNILEDPIYNSRNSDIIINEIIPLLIKFNIIEERETNNSKQIGGRAWSLKSYDLEEIKRAEENPKCPLYEFWRIVNEHK